MAYMMDYEGNEITQEYAERVLLAHLDESKHVRRAATMLDGFKHSAIPKKIRSEMFRDMDEFNFRQLIKHYGAVMLAAACDAGYRTPVDETLHFDDIDDYIQWRREYVSFHE